MAYSQEQYIQNRTLKVDDKTKKGAVEYYIDKCLLTENAYNEIRRALPSFLLDSKGIIDDLESSNLCKVAYKTDPTKLKACEMVYD